MKVDLSSPIWYSQDSMYVSEVKSTDFELDSDCVHLKNENADFTPSEQLQKWVLEGGILESLVEQTQSWFTTPLTKEQIQKRLHFEFPKFEYETEDKWMRATWCASFFKVLKRGFVLGFKISKLTPCSPRIPLTFLESITPRATTPTEESEETKVRNIVLHPGAGPLDLQEVSDIPLYDVGGSFEIRDERAREKHRLHQAKLRSAIARLKVEEMKERYLRKYGDEYLEESSDSEGEDSTDSEFSESLPKK